MPNQQVINAIAEKVAEAVADKFEQRLSLCEQGLRIKGTQMKEIETKMAHMEVCIDQLEQYSRRTSVRISGVKESELGEDLTTVVTDILANINPDITRVTIADVNRAHRVGQRKRQDRADRATTTSQAHTGAIQDEQTERPQHPRHILVQFKMSRQSDHNIPGTYWFNSRSADRATTTSQAHTGSIQDQQTERPQHPRHILVQFKISRQSDHNIPGTHTGAIQDQQTERPQHPRHILVQFNISRQSDHNIPGTHTGSIQDQQTERPQHPRHILVQFKISRQSDHNIPGTYWFNSRSADRATTTSQAHILVQFKISRQSDHNIPGTYWFNSRSADRATTTSQAHTGAIQDQQTERPQHPRHILVQSKISRQSDHNIPGTYWFNSRSADRATTTSQAHTGVIQDEQTERPQHPRHILVQFKMSRQSDHNIPGTYTGSIQRLQ